jgi:hypothetical protein
LSWRVIKQSFYTHQLSLSGEKRNNNTHTQKTPGFFSIVKNKNTKVNQALLQDSQVKFVGSTVAGLEHVDQDYLTANNITFFYLLALEKCLQPKNPLCAENGEGWVAVKTKCLLLSMSAAFL